MAPNDVQALIKRGIEAAQAGNKKAAKDSFVQALKHDPRNELAWMWMVSVVETEKERRFCLQKILEINPGNARARQALAQMQRTQLPDWLSRPATAEETLKPRPAQPAPPTAYEPPAGAPDAAEAAAPAGLAGDDWAAWPESSAFEGDDATRRRR
ncbi:MAG: hypothetical protein M5R40_23975 [Anaerolineae bacterium]|nr:hypothetical protein [Anaerolineae bacterium]